jgi:hypothetical protein
MPSVPDRLAGRATLADLCAAFPARRFQFVEINVAAAELAAVRCGRVLGLQKIRTVSPPFLCAHTHIHTHTHIYIYIYIPIDADRLFTTPWSLSPHQPARADAAATPRDGHGREHRLCALVCRTRRWPARRCVCVCVCVCVCAYPSSLLALAHQAPGQPYASPAKASGAKGIT